MTKAVPDTERLVDVRTGGAWRGAGRRVRRRDGWMEQKNLH